MLRKSTWHDCLVEFIPIAYKLQIRVIFLVTTLSLINAVAGTSLLSETHGDNIYYLVELINKIKYR